MKHSKSRLLAFLVCFSVIASCGESKPTYEASSEKAKKASMEEMTSNLSPEKKEKFELYVNGLYGNAYGLAKQDDVSMEQARKMIGETLDGKTVEEILRGDAAQEVRALHYR